MRPGPAPPGPAPPGPPPRGGLIRGPPPPGPIGPGPIGVLPGPRGPAPRGPVVDGGPTPGPVIGTAPPGRGAMLNVNCHWSYRVAPRYERSDVSSLLLRTPLMPAAPKLGV